MKSMWTTGKEVLENGQIWSTVHFTPFQPGNSNFLAPEVPLSSESQGSISL